MFPESNIKISNVLKYSPRLRAVPLGLRYQEIGSSINFSVFFPQSGMARAGPKKLWTNLCYPQLHQLIQASAKVGHAVDVMIIII